MNNKELGIDVDGVLITEKLDSRPSRLRDFEAENRALAALAQTMALNPGRLLQQLTEQVMALTGCDSAGISLLEAGGEQGVFRWIATTGAWGPYCGGTMPREQSPCGMVLARDGVLLMKRPERIFPALLQAKPGIAEALLAPFHICGVAAGTVWAITHASDGLFNREDARILQSLVHFASAGYQMVVALENSEAGRLESDKRLRALAHASSDVFYIMDPGMRELRELSGGQFIADATSPSVDWVEDRIPQEERPRTLAAIRRAIGAKSVFELEHRVHRPDGEVGWAMSRAVPILGADGEIVEWFGAASDVTARKQAELAVHGRVKRQAFLLKLSDDIRALSDEKAIGTLVTHRLAEHLRLDRCCLAVLFPDEDRVIVGPEHRRADLAPASGEYRLSDFPEVVRRVRTQTVVVGDVANDPAMTEAERAGLMAIDIGAFITAGVRKGDDTVLWALIAMSSTVRGWTTNDGELVESVAEHAWAAVERARAEATLRAAEKSHRAIFTGTSAGFLVLSPDAPHFTITDVNDAYLSATNTRREDLIGRALFEVFPQNPDDPDATYVQDLRASLDRVLATRRRDALPRLKYDIPAPGGGFEQRWWDPIQTPLLDPDGAVTAIIHHATDQTDAERAQASLRQSEERLRQFGEASQDILWIRDATTVQWIYLTPAFETIYGLSRETALTGDNFRRWQELIVPEDRDHAVASIARVAAGEQVTFEYRVRRPVDGTIRWLRNTDFPITDAAGKVVLIGGIGHDFTEVREAELRLQVLVEGIPQLVWRAVDSGKWTWASPQWTEYTGQEEADYKEWGWLGALHPEDQDKAREAWSHALDDGGFKVEYRLRRRSDGEHRWFQTRATPVRDQAGAIIEWLGTSTDVNDLRELQEQQKVLVAELQHRTRNLMAVVRSMGDRTSRASADLPDFRARFRDRLDALARVQGLLSRMNDRDRVTFDELVDTELAALNGSADRVTVDGPKGVRLRSSMVQTLAMALHELATNAVKYGALGQPSGRLAIIWRLDSSAQDGTPWLHIDWRESGVKMPPPGAAPIGTGQGRELIERALPYQLRAKTTYELGPHGAHCTISIPVSVTTMETDEHG